MFVARVRFYGMSEFDVHKSQARAAPRRICANTWTVHTWKPAAYGRLHGSTAGNYLPVTVTVMEIIRCGPLTHAAQDRCEPC